VSCTPLTIANEQSVYLQICYVADTETISKKRMKNVNLALKQGSGTYGSRARCGSVDDSIWLVWYFLNTIATNETFSIIFHLPDYKTINNIMQHQKSH